MSLILPRSAQQASKPQFFILTKLLIRNDKEGETGTGDRTPTLQETEDKWEGFFFKVVPSLSLVYSAFPLGYNFLLDWPEDSMSLSESRKLSFKSVAAQNNEIACRDWNV